MMVALYERPDIRKRNKSILSHFRIGRLSRKEIATKFEVTRDVVNNVIKAARRHKAHGSRRRCTCRGRR